MRSGWATACSSAWARRPDARVAYAVNSDPHRVVIVGGGFGGLFAARNVSRAPVQVTLVDRTNHHLFQPLLYQVATGILSEGEIATATRDILKNHENVAVAMAEVTGLDLKTKQVTVVQPDGRAMTLGYDSLIVGAGVGQSYFGHEEFAEWAPGMKTLADALDQRARIFGAFEMAELIEDPEARQAWLTFVVVGGGPTGVETSGQVAELSRRALKHNFRRFDPADVRVLLFEGGKEILASFGDRLSEKGTRELERTGVEIHVESIVTRGVAAREDAGRRLRRRVRPWRPHQGAGGLLATRPPRGLRGRRHDELRRPPRRRRGGSAVRHPRSQDDHPATRRQGTAAIPLPRPGQHGRRLPSPRNRQLPRDPCDRLPWLADVAGRAHHLHDRLQEPIQNPDQLVVQLPRVRPHGARAHSREDKQVRLERCNRRGRSDRSPRSPRSQ